MSSLTRKLFARMLPLLLASLMVPAVASTYSYADPAPQAASAADKLDLNTAPPTNLKPYPASGMRIPRKSSPAVPTAPSST
jgi:hypothetical protein